MNTYDEVPYPVYSHSQTHPAGMATLATLHGMTPPAVEGSRVLELGCASGGNLIPMALELPESEFVGIDSSARQISIGQAYASALGLKNIALRHGDVADVGPDFGQFDYIICHGLFSWVPEGVQEKILEICRRHLSPSGVAFVSYNTLPGWRTLSVIREMLLYHIRGASEPQVQTARARSLLNFLANTTLHKPTAVGGLVKAYAEFFRYEVESLGAAHDSYLLHEMLEEVNDPIYFSEFVARAGRHGLQYLSEIEFRASLASNLPEDLAQGVLNMARDVTEWEQYVDFFRGRTFRQTLLCHQEVAISRTMKPEAVTSFYLASAAKPVGQEVDPLAVQDFGDPETLSLSTDHGVTKATLTYLAEIWPRFVSFDAAIRHARAKVSPGDGGADRADLDARMLCSNLLTAFTFSSRLVELSVYAPRFVTDVVERPVASPWARLQAQEGFVVTNLRHERVNLNPVQGYVLLYLDGTRDKAALLHALMVGPVASGKMTIRHNQVPLQDPAQIRQVLEPEIDDALVQLARSALLVG